ncbi:unnamed protein product, partial [Coregonus sp. 'balchen']
MNNMLNETQCCLVLQQRNVQGGLNNNINNMLPLLIACSRGWAMLQSRGCGMRGQYLGLGAEEGGGGGGLEEVVGLMYYWAAQSRFLAQWFDNGPPPSWLNVETWDMKSIKTITDNPLIIHSVLTWSKLQHELFRREGFISPKTPLWNNRLIPMFFQNSTIRLWSEKGITLLEHSYEEGILMSFEQLKQKYHLSNKDFFSYLQLWHVIKVNLKGQRNLPNMSPIEQLCHADRPLFKTISCVYNARTSGPELDKSRLRWEKDLGINLDEGLWSDLCRDGVTSTLNSRYRLIQFNFLHQLCITPSR